MKLYKFFSLGIHLKNNLDDLKNNKVWMSKSENFNDIYDCNLLLKEGMCFFEDPEIKEAVKALYKNRLIVNGTGVLNQDLINGFLDWANCDYQGVSYNKIQKIFNGFKARVKSLGVTCFSEIYDSPLMWAHYAESHKGFCVEYDFEPMMIFIDLDDNPSDSRGNIKSNFFMHTVSYVSKLPSVGMDEVFFTPLEVTKKMLATKSYHWAYEQERRLIAFDEVIPTGKAGFSYDYPSQMKPKAIILGAKASPETREAVQAVCADMDWAVKEMHIGKTGRFELKPTDDEPVIVI